MGIFERFENKFIFLDGAMGTELQRRGLPPGENPDVFSVTHSEIIIDIHKKYIAAGADIIYTNTFGANRSKLKGSTFSPADIIKKAVANARVAAEGTDVLVAHDIGPIGQLLEPGGTLSFDDAYDIFKEQILCSNGADLIVFETLTDLYEAKAALLAAKENSDLPVFVTMSFEENGRTFSGVPVSAAAITLQGLGADAIGFNCSLGPENLIPIAKELSRFCKIPIIAKPNAGLPGIDGTFSVSPLKFADEMVKLSSCGVKIIGGCCGTSPEHITALHSTFSTMKPTEFKLISVSAVCSGSNTIVIDSPKIIGERINPTGKKDLKEALRNGDMNHIMKLALSQVAAGADILDLNVGLPDIDEKKIMKAAVKSIQSVTGAPLQIDSSNVDAIDTALRYYNGKPIVNSVNGDEESLAAILPLVKKYGASVVGLTLDKNGIPKKSTERVRIAERILKAAISEGIPKEDVFIDCLTLTVSAEPQAVSETLEAVKFVKKDLELRTVLGVSNISFGLPAREHINSAFLNIALESGLDMPIMNPESSQMFGAFAAFKVLNGLDKGSENFIKFFGTGSNQKQYADVANLSLFESIESGLPASAVSAAEFLLNANTPFDIINGHLIPALDHVGKRFEKGEVFLPQLIQSASAAEAAFKILKNNIFVGTDSTFEKGTVVLATVKNDIHDIGKNIVKVLLESYGYNIIDLGKNVSPEMILEAVLRQNCKLCGLSALMTTTLPSMEETIKLLKTRAPFCRIMVGGAVLTQEYASEIGADFYSDNATGAVEIAKAVLK